jgi:hypothetical protein
VRATVEFFGPTDFFSAFARELAEDALRGQLRALPGLAHLDAVWLQPLRLGQISYEDVRRALLRRSPAPIHGPRAVMMKVALPRT